MAALCAVLVHRRYADSNMLYRGICDNLHSTLQGYSCRITDIVRHPGLFDKDPYQAPWYLNGKRTAQASRSVDIHRVNCTYSWGSWTVIRKEEWSLFKFFCIAWFINEGLNNTLINSVFLLDNFINNTILLIVDGKEL